MALYQISIVADNVTAALWPDLKAFDGLTRRRRDAAIYQLQKAVYEAASGLALRDRQIAHDAMCWARMALRDSFEMSGITFTFKRIA